MADTEPLTPDAVRALIAELRTEAEYWSGRYSTRPLLERAATAFEASLPREDADLDAIERHARELEYVSQETFTALEVLALLARVRTAEAAREHWERENNSLWSWILALGALAKKGGFQDGGLGWQTYISRAVHAAVEDRASRTVETAEEWEYAAEANGILVPMGEDQRTFRGETLRRRRPAGPWEPVPPTPEEGDRA
ncbi:hypothetical protein C5C95_06125 [Rathayibacter sp. AY1B7]|uniref:hypothetical protein n=1 Tax=Rathayibacter sp. AY1B7 TaxID=2080532 RepID=UPI000CE80BD2|nr:hypothetical protein [Rathayibacter sp. AY1B7]PPH99717.1 hypothetical protein C5C95_06125 [Rathayibacter sp. AY1B7]